MAYIIYCQGNDIEIPTIDYTVGELITYINTDNIVLFGGIKLNYLLPSTPLADIGLGPECTIHITDSNFMKEVWDEYLICITNIYSNKSNTIIKDINEFLTKKRIEYIP